MASLMQKAKKKISSIRKQNMMEHRHKRSMLLKFIILLAVVVIYTAFILAEFGIEKGLLITGLTWSVFVFCVPFAASDILVGLPLRALFNIKLFLSQIIVWVSAAALNIYSFINHPYVYQSTPLLKVFHYILSNPFPYWTILALCGFGTFLSVILADDVLDDLDPKAKHHPKTVEFLFLAILIIIAIVYSTLLSELQISLN